MKTCPKCKTEHNKLGKFCSRKCANSRTWSAEDRQKKSVSGKQFYLTPEGKELKTKLATQAKEKEWSDEEKTKLSQSLKLLWTDEKRQKQSELLKGRLTSPETREKMSKNAIRRGFGGHTSKRKIFFKKMSGEVVYLQSSYEIEFATILEELCIDWSRPDPMIWVDSDGKQHRYYADFKVGEVYIDTKNDYLAIKDLPKIQAVIEQNNVDLRIVTKNQITKDFIGRLV